MRVIGTMERGIMLIFIPLLTLSTDVLDKFVSAKQKYGKVRVFHLDELVDNAPTKYDAFLQTCYGLPIDTANTVFAFLSPHHLIRHPRSLKALLNAAENGSLRSVVMDEVHLHVQHGTSFREECRALTTQFFKPVFHPQGRTSTVRFLATSATIPAPYIPEIARLTTLRFPSASVIRGCVNEFEQRDIAMEQLVCNPSDFVRVGHERIIHFLKSEDGKAVCFCNSKFKSFHYVHEMERKLDEAGEDIDCFHIHGSLTKYEKFWRIRIFCENT